MLVHMKADRLLSALLLLQAHGRLSSRELADRLEVCVRTVHRDMEALSASGVPVLALRGARGGCGSVEDLSALPTVQAAAAADRTLRIRYEQPGHAPSERMIDPLGLVAKGTTWYLVANTRDGFRTYRVSRIKEATMLDSGFERPPNFDLAAFWKSSTEEFRQKRCYVTTLRVERGSVAGVRMWC